ncbi:D-ribose pyranase [Weissella confusa]|nr:D-ribose pyranase [Weissella confusa]MBJ7670438.1 D-ribose pyranase [Weissella confusa]
MKKTGILNSRISAVVAQMGHKDTLAIGDAGLPVPMGTEKIDLAVKLQDPTFQTVLETVLTELEVEGITLAEEIKTANPEQLAAIKKVLPDVEVTFISHEEFKKELANTRAVIRTGE